MNLDFLKNYVIQIVIGVFALGGIYTRFLMAEKDIQTLDDRLGKKIKLIKDLDTRLHNLERCAD